jgi:ubiquinone/menaquinone biosynthesis C-methylase UbiE
MTKLKKLKRNWDELGKIDPLWATITSPEKKERKWRVNEFFETGLKEVDALMKYIESLGINIPHRQALDFGCGVGRVSQALTKYFDMVYGVDIAPSMIDLAKRYNRHRYKCKPRARRRAKCKYYLNETDNLMLFTDDYFDFIYSSITLQHIPPEYCWKYIREFLRVLVPQGLLIFQVPDEPSLRASVRELCSRLKAKCLGQPRIEMYGIERREVIKLVEENGGRIVDITQDKATGPEWRSLRYCVTKRAPDG